MNRIVNGEKTRRITYEHTVTGCQKQPFSMPGDAGAFVFFAGLQVVGMVVTSMELEPITFITHVDDIFTDIKATTGASAIRVMDDTDMELANQHDAPWRNSPWAITYFQ